MHLRSDIDAIRPFLARKYFRSFFKPGGSQKAIRLLRGILSEDVKFLAVANSESARRVNALCAQFSNPRYLEVGVQAGATFLAVEASLRVGVDPEPRFQVSSPSSRLFIERSDHFFSRVEPYEFDVIFLDGLHTAEQTWRDLINSFSTAHVGTYWLIDDVVPTDMLAAIPDQQIAESAAREAGIPVRGGRAWQGDVFRIVDAINSRLSELQFATIVGSGKEQLLVWVRLGQSVPRSERAQLEVVLANDSYSDVFRNGVIPASFHPSEEREALTRAVSHSDG